VYFYLSTEGGVSYSGDVKTKRKVTVKRIFQRKNARQPVIIVVPNGKISRSELSKLARNPKLLDEDEADYQYSMAAIREGGRPVSAESVLKKYGRRVDR
jgi:hypothetical protein